MDNNPTTDAVTQATVNLCLAVAEEMLRHGVEPFHIITAFTKAREAVLQQYADRSN